MSGSVTVVRACTDGGEGGSPTAVIADAPSLTDAGRLALAARAGTSHTAFVTQRGPGEIGVRFFTPERELAACGHGTVAVHAALGPGTRRQRTGGRTLTATTTDAGAEREVRFGLGPVALEPVAADVLAAVLGALGLEAGDGAPLLAAAPAPRLLPPVAAGVLDALEPDHAALAAATRAAGLLGCFAYARLEAARFAARMFAPAIGVDEDVANANSSGCLAAALAAGAPGGEAEIVVEQGRRAAHPSVVRARASRTARALEASLSGRAVVPGARG